MQAVVTGFHAIEESVNAIQKSKKNPQNVKLFYSKVGPRVKKILATAKEAGVSSVQVENSKLDVKSFPARVIDVTFKSTCIFLVPLHLCPLVVSLLLLY